MYAVSAIVLSTNQIVRTGFLVDKPFIVNWLRKFLLTRIEFPNIRLSNM